jgi:hypothetical protein
VTREEYEKDIATRVHEAVLVPFRKVALDCWTPEPNDCHNNVNAWIEANTGLAAVRGWIVESIGSLTAHSVIRDIDGQLFDITPFYDETLRLAFVEHYGDDATFDQMKAAGVQIFCLTVDPDELAEHLRGMSVALPGEDNEWTL